MLGDFTYSNPTRLHFGKNSLEKLNDELQNFGDNILLTYGGGSIKKTGLYDQIIQILEDNGKNIIELSGVMPNPTSDKLREGKKIAEENDIDLILAIGGGSVIDYSKAVSVAAGSEGDPWERFYLNMEEPDTEIIPVGSVLTMVGTGSEMNAGSVITDTDSKLKIGHVYGEEVMPKFAILNPELTFTVPEYQMKAGIFDIMSHILEQYMSGDDENVSDYISEGLMRSLIQASREAVKNPENYEARSNLMWLASWALNTLISRGKATDWMVHMIGQSVSGFTDATHGMTLAAVSPAYYNHIMENGLDRFKRFAINVWDVNPEGKTDKEIAKEGLKAMEDWMDEIGLVRNLSDLGVTEDMLEGIADGTFIMEGVDKVLDKPEVIEILKESM